MGAETMTPGYDWLQGSMSQLSGLQQQLQDPAKFQQIVEQAALLFPPPPGIAEAVGAVGPQATPAQPLSAPFSQVAPQVPNPTGLNIGGPQLMPQEAPQQMPPGGTPPTVPPDEEMKARARAEAFQKMAQQYIMAQQQQLAQMRPAPVGSYGRTSLMPRVAEAQAPNPAQTPAPTLGQLLRGQ